MDGEHWTRFVICRREYRSSFALWVVLLFALGLGLVLLLNGILVYLVNTRDGIIHDLVFHVVSLLSAIKLKDFFHLLSHFGIVGDSLFDSPHAYLSWRNFIHQRLRKTSLLAVLSKCRFDRIIALQVRLGFLKRLKV